MGKRILLVEDESRLALMIADRLHSEGYEVASSSDGIEAVSRATTENFDLVVLDVMLPRKNGFDVCRDLRQQGTQTPVIMLTARGQVVDKVVGLKLGADDYMTKPFEMIELIARIEALLRRSSGSDRERSADGTFQFGEILVNFRTTEVFRSGQRIKLSAREFKLLRHFIENIGTTFSRDQLLNSVWGY